MCWSSCDSGSASLHVCGSAEVGGAQRGCAVDRVGLLDGCRWSSWLRKMGTLLLSLVLAFFGHFFLEASRGGAGLCGNLGLVYFS